MKHKKTEAKKRKKRPFIYEIGPYRDTTAKHEAQGRIVARDMQI